MQADELYVETECWDIKTIEDSDGIEGGFVLSCGTGIKSCDQPNFSRKYKK